MTALPAEAEFRPPNGQPQYVRLLTSHGSLPKRKAGATAAQFGSLDRVYANSQHRMHRTGLIFAHSLRNGRAVVSFAICFIFGVGCSCVAPLLTTALGVAASITRALAA